MPLFLPDFLEDDFLPPLQAFFITSVETIAIITSPILSKIYSIKLSIKNKHALLRFLYNICSFSELARWLYDVIDLFQNIYSQFGCMYHTYAQGLYKINI